MLAGRRVHEQLEAACQLPDATDISVETAEDAFVARILDTLCKLSHLGPTHSRVRELWCAAYQEAGVWITGVIDELQYDDNGRAVVVDDKTRMRPMLPHERRQTATRLQVALYRYGAGSGNSPQTSNAGGCCSAWLTTSTPSPTWQRCGAWTSTRH